MSHPADDERILAGMERELTHDDPALSATMETLNQQFPEQPERPAKARLPRRDPRLVTAVVLAVIAVLALILTAALNTTPAPPDGRSPGRRRIPPW